MAVNSTHTHWGGRYTLPPLIFNSVAPYFTGFPVPYLFLKTIHFRDSSISVLKVSTFIINLHLFYEYITSITDLTSPLVMGI